MRAWAIATCVVAALLPSAAAGQRPHRSGLWFELGTGPAAVRVACTGCAAVRTSGGSGGFLRVGGTLSDRVVLGVETFGFTDETFDFSADDTSFVASTGTVAAVVLWFPWRSGAFLKGGVGIAAGEFTAAPTPVQPARVEGVGVGLTFGVGYDLNLSRKLAVSANAAAHITAIGDLVLPSGTVDDVIATMYVVAIGLTVR